MVELSGTTQVTLMKAVYHHSISTDSNPDHQYWPPGPDSWCKCWWPTTQAQTYIPCILSSGLRWVPHRTRTNLRCPKTEFCSLTTVEVAVGLAVLTFNHGSTGLRSLGLKMNGFTPMQPRQYMSETLPICGIEESRVEREGTT